MELQSSLRYLESFDSTRFEESSVGVERAKRLLHSEIELLLAWLFGEVMPVPEPYSADSAGFLDIASRVISANPQETVGKLPPFRLGVRLLPDRPVDPAAHLSYLDIAALQFNSGMILTAWPSINTNRPAREQLANALRKRDFGAASAILDSDIERSKLEQIKQIDIYFDEKHRYSITSSPELLMQFIEGLQTLVPQELPPELRDRVDHLKRAAADVSGVVGVDLRNRSDVRLKRDEYMQLPSASAEAFDDLLDFIDTAYNMVLRHSLRAGSSVYTSRQFEEPEHDFVGEIIARKIEQRILGFARIVDTETKPLVVFEPPVLDILPSHTIHTLPRVAWGAIWDLAQSGQFQDQLRKLRETVGRIPNAVSGRHRSQLVDLAQKELENHINLIARVAYPYIIHAQGFSLRVLWEAPRRFIEVRPAAGATGALQTIAASGISAAGALALVLWSGDIFSLVPGALGAGALAAFASTIVSRGLEKSVSWRNSEQRRLDGVVQQLRKHVRLNSQG